LILKSEDRTCPASPDKGVLSGIQLRVQSHSAQLPNQRDGATINAIPALVVADNRSIYLP
jgi:hypothetical protein